MLLLFGFGAKLQTFLPELQTSRVCLEFKRGCPHCGPSRRQLKWILTTYDHSGAVPSCPVWRVACEEQGKVTKRRASTNQTTLSLQPQPLRHENKLIPGREQDKNPQEQLNEVEIGNQPVEELKDAKVWVAQPCLTLCNATLTVACQAPLSMEFSRQEYWSGLSFPSPGDLPNPGIKPKSLAL